MGPDVLEDSVVRVCARGALSNSSHSSCSRTCLIGVCKCTHVELKGELWGKDPL